MHGFDSPGLFGVLSLLTVIGGRLTATETVVTVNLGGFVLGVAAALLVVLRSLDPAVQEGSRGVSRAT